MGRTVAQTPPRYVLFCEPTTRDQNLVLVEAQLPEKERPDISVTIDGSAHITIAVVSGLGFAAQEDGPVRDVGGQP